MPDNIIIKTMADLPAQRHSNPATAAQKRARYFNSGNAFMVKLPPVPNMVFIEEPLRALSDASPTGLIPCDASSQMDSPFPATSPLVLAYYARICKNEELKTEFIASGTIVYVIKGMGITKSGKETIHWGEGDIFIIPGGDYQLHRAHGETVVLWIVTNEPQLAFENLNAPDKGQAPTEVVHYPSDEINRQFNLMYDAGQNDEIAGSALIFSSDKQEKSRNALPTLTVAMNSLPPKAVQKAHKHNSAAIALVIQGESCFSMIDGERKDWAPWATTITPPVSVHSHHNVGYEMARFLIVQDGGIFSHVRAMGFEFVDE